MGRKTRIEKQVERVRKRHRRGREMEGRNQKVGEERIKRGGEDKK